MSQQLRLLFGTSCAVQKVLGDINRYAGTRYPLRRPYIRHLATLWHSGMNPCPVAEVLLAGWVAGPFPLSQSESAYSMASF
jgi:hypothetical protein